MRRKSGDRWWLLQGKHAGGVSQRCLLSSPVFHSSFLTVYLWCWHCSFNLSSFCSRFPYGSHHYYNNVQNPKSGLQDLIKVVTGTHLMPDDRWQWCESVSPAHTRCPLSDAIQSYSPCSHSVSPIPVITATFQGSWLPNQVQLIRKEAKLCREWQGQGMTLPFAVLAPTLSGSFRVAIT